MPANSGPLSEASPTLRVPSYFQAALLPFSPSASKIASIRIGYACCMLYADTYDGLHGKVRMEVNPTSMASYGPYMQM